MNSPYYPFQMPKTHREIVLAAYNYLAEVTPPTQRISDVRIEELQPFDENEKKFWNVILSFDNEGAYPFDKKREYKKFKVTDEGQVISMKSAYEPNKSNNSPNRRKH